MMKKTQSKTQFMWMRGLVGLSRSKTYRLKQTNPFKMLIISLARIIDHYLSQRGHTKPYLHWLQTPSRHPNSFQMHQINLRLRHQVQNQRIGHLRCLVSKHVPSKKQNKQSKIFPKLSSSSNKISSRLSRQLNNPFQDLSRHRLSSPIYPQSQTSTRS